MRVWGISMPIGSKVTYFYFISLKNLCRLDHPEMVYQKVGWMPGFLHSMQALCVCVFMTARDFRIQKCSSHVKETSLI